jgi:hypothetical protein
MRVLILCALLFLSLLVSRQAEAARQSFVAEDLAVPGGMVANDENQRPDHHRADWFDALRSNSRSGSEGEPVNEYSWDDDCQYAAANEILADIRSSLGPNSHYERVWMQNQDLVFSACDGRPVGETPPAKPPREPSMPARAATDFAYQMASWNFYQRKFEAALTGYRGLVGMGDAPLRPRASYMVLRSLSELGRDREALEQIDKMLADPSLLPVHDKVASYRFVISWKVLFDTWKQTDVEPAVEVLWLLSVLDRPLGNASPSSQLAMDRHDALTQLSLLVGSFDTASGSIDWWLAEAPAASADMRAIQSLAHQSETLDWMKAWTAYNVLDRDWLWALHRAESRYWERNSIIVAHAWNRWLQGDGLEWLQIAARRIRPGDQPSGDILAAIEPYLHKPWRGESDVYKAWLIDMWAQSIRIYLGRQEYGEAIALIADHPDFSETMDKVYVFNGVDGAFNQNYSPDYENVLNASLRWLFYTGHVEEARSLLALLEEHASEGFIDWRIRLARSVDELTAVNKLLINQPQRGGDFSIWREMANSFSSPALMRFASDLTMRGVERSYMARALLTRSILLGAGPQKLEEAARLAADLNPGIGDQIRNAATQQSYEGFISLLLRNPRLRPLPFAVSPSFYTDVDQNWDFAFHDPFDINDNNWWCRVKQADLEDRLFDAAGVLPTLYHRGYSANLKEITSFASERVFLDTPVPTSEFAPYIERQQKFFARHPYRLLVDPAELKQLSFVPSGPRYLTGAAIAIAQAAADKGSEQREAAAANLSLAITTTRYGCQRDGSHALYSRAAYDLLHAAFADSSWAKKTRYWFGCSHFRGGCPKQPADEVLDDRR